MSANLFKKAVALEAPIAAAKKADKKEHVELKGLKELAEIDALIKSLSTIKASLEADVKGKGFDTFFEMAQNGKRPDSFRGTDGTASASVEMRKRSTASVLSDSEVDLLTSHGIKVEKKVTTQMLFAINPSYAADGELLEKVSEAISAIVPEDFIMVQEEKSSNVVSDETIEAAFAKRAPREVIKTITTMALKPKLETTDLKVILDDIKHYIIETEVAK
jgi:hypothetical protein